MTFSRFWILGLLGLTTLSCDGNGELPPAREVYEGEDPPVLDCIPNLDGRIEVDEVPLMFDTEVAYLVSPAGSTRTVDIAGGSEGEKMLWNWSVDFADDQIARLAASSTEGRWYADSFPPDAFVAAFDDGGGIDSISRQDERGLYLLGLASAEADPSSGRTLLIYETPVELIKFPIELGTQHTEVGLIEDAMFYGIPYASVDTYDIHVDAIGELRLPSFTFTQTHRIRIDLTIEPALGEVTTVRQVSYFFECFGEIARATSVTNEPEADFTEAAEVRRIGF